MGPSNILFPNQPLTFPLTIHGTRLLVKRESTILDEHNVQPPTTIVQDAFGDVQNKVGFTFIVPVTVGKTVPLDNRMQRVDILTSGGSASVKHHR